MGRSINNSRGVHINMIIDYGYDVAFEVSGMGNFSDKAITVII